MLSTLDCFKEGQTAAIMLRNSSVFTRCLRQIQPKASEYTLARFLPLARETSHCSKMSGCCDNTKKEASHGKWVSVHIRQVRASVGVLVELVAKVCNYFLSKDVRYHAWGIGFWGVPYGSPPLL